MRVLLVEDDPSWAESVALMLRRAGHDAEVQELGRRAVVRAMETPFDLIVLDILLPDIDGYEVIEALQEAGSTTPILVQSGLVARARRDDARAFGVDEIIIKPFDQAELEARMAEALANHAAELARAEPAPEAAEHDEVTGDPTAIPEITPDSVLNGARDRVIRAAQIIIGREQIRCMVLNLAEGGAAIRLPGHMKQCPGRFTLRLAEDDKRPCEVCWRVHDKIGVKFLEA